MFCAFSVGALCFVLWLRRVEASRTKYRWRELTSSGPLYRAWRDLRERSRLVPWTLVTGWALSLLLSRVVFRVQSEVLSLGSNAAEVSSRLYEARHALGVAKWNELGFTDSRTSGLEWLVLGFGRPITGKGLRTNILAERRPNNCPALTVPLHDHGPPLCRS
jgi:hypothetical protein